MITGRSTFIPGHARPKGSLEPQMVRAGNGKLTGRVRMNETPQSRLWRRTVADHVSELGWETLVGPCVVEMTFWFDPACVAHRLTQWDEEDYPTHPHIGDLDKLVRNVLDALQDAEVYTNDRQVVGLADTTKRWARPWYDERAGLGLRVWPKGRATP
jgi:Holliday junction resolvase RusA-like endonuclease